MACNTREENAEEMRRQEQEREAAIDTSEEVTMIALDTFAVEQEIEERIGLGGRYDDPRLHKIKRSHINEALRALNPSDGFYQMFDDLRADVIDLAVRIADKADSAS